jgi:hypothetical protein
VNHDAVDDPAIVQAEMLPGLAAIRGTINAVAPAGRIAVVRLTGADPQHIRIRRRQSQGADGKHGLFVENRVECNAVVPGFDNAAGGQAGVEGVRIARVQRDVRDPAAHHRGPDGARLEILEQRLRKGRLRRNSLPMRDRHKERHQTGWDKKSGVAARHHHTRIGA